MLYVLMSCKSQALYQKVFYTTIIVMCYMGQLNWLTYL